MKKVKSSIKSIKKNKIYHLNNISKKSKIRNLIKKVKYTIHKKDKEKSLIEFKKLQSILDRYSKKRIIHKNKASRHKKRLMNQINNIK